MPAHTPAKPSSAQQFSRDYRRLVAQVTQVTQVTQVSLVAEGPPAGDHRPVREKLVRCLWFEQYFDTATLRTEDGRHLSLYSPGSWNEGPGPDFRNAEFAFADSPRIRGDIELHVQSSAWNQHGHAADPAYRNVKLHVVLDNDLNTPTIAHASGPIPQLALRRHLTADLAEIINSLDPQSLPQKGVGREGPCCRSARAMGRDEKWLAHFLDAAGDERMLTRAGLFTQAMRQSTPDETMYRALMDCMGYSANRHGFRLLARAAPLAQLRKWTPLDAPPEQTQTALQALLFGVAGFLTPGKNAARPDPDTDTYRQKLRALWQPAASTWPTPLLTPSAWVQNRTRPTNRPARRIPAIAAFLARHLHSGLCRAMLAAVESIPATGRDAGRCRHTVDTLCALFDGKPDTYWQRRTGFGPPTLARPNRLIGPTRTVEIVVNAVIPILLALSQDADRPRVEQQLHNLYLALPPLADNSVTRYMKRRLFPAPDKAKRIVSTARRQQGLLQVFHDFCETTDTTCESCGLLAAVEGSTP